MKRVRFRLIPTLAAVAAIVVLSVGQAAACTGITLSSKDGGAVRGRTMEFAAPVNSDLLLMPRGLVLTGTTPDANAPGMS